MTFAASVPGMYGAERCNARATPETHLRGEPQPDTLPAALRLSPCAAPARPSTALGSGKRRQAAQQERKGTMSLLDMVLNAQNGGVVQQMGSQFGLSQDQTTAALGALVPALAAGL